MTMNFNAISVVIVTKNEAKQIGACLQSLTMFNDIHVVDSYSTDDTIAIAKHHGATVTHFQWNEHYPKKRQWCLDTLGLQDWVLFIDADERMTDCLAREIETCALDHAGYFIRGHYVVNDVGLKYGLKNNKLCLINRHAMHFPVVDDLDIDGMGEIEGHYQPVMRDMKNTIGQLTSPLLHHADTQNWHDKHRRYARWQAIMNARNANPQDPRMIKRIWHKTPCKPFAAFIHSYILKFGFLDGKNGFIHAYRRGQYYAMIARANTQTASHDAPVAPPFDAP